MKKTIIFIIVFLISLVSVYSANVINVHDSFDGNYGYDVTSCTHSDSLTNITYTIAQTGTVRSFDLDWYCFYDEFTGTITNHSTNSNNYRVIPPMESQLVTAEPTGDSTLEFIFDIKGNDYYFDNDSIINVTIAEHDYLSQIGGEKGGYIKVYQNDGRGYKLQTSTTDVQYVGTQNVPAGKICTSVGTEHIFKDINDYVKFEHYVTGQDIIDRCSDFSNENDLLNITHISLVITNNYQGTQRYYFDEFDLTVMNGSNRLPDFNVSIINQTYVCFNDTQTSKTVNLSIVARDFENNTIYYSLIRLDDFLRYNIFQEDSTYKFLNSENFISNYSHTVDFYQSQLWAINTYTNKPYVALGSILNNDIIITEIGVDKWVFSFDDVLEGNVFTSYLLGFSTLDTYMSTIYKSSLGNEVLNITYNLTSAQNLTIKVDGTLIYNQYQGLFNNNFENFIVMTGLIYQDNDTIFLQFDNDYTNVITNYTYNKSLEGVSLIEFDTKDTKGSYPFNNNENWIIDNINVRGYNYVPNIPFSLIKPSSIILNETGLNLISLYVTDSKHLEKNIYAQKIVYTNVIRQNYCIAREDIFGKTTTGRIKVFGDTFAMLCSSFDKTMSIFGITINSCVFLAIFYFGMTLVLSGFLALLIAKVSFNLSLGYFVFSISYFLFAVVGTFLFNINKNYLIAFALLLVSGIVTLINMIFGGNQQVAQM